MNKDIEIHWYVLRCFYGKELALLKQVQGDFNVECFVPIEKVKQRDSHGRFIWIERCALTGYIFVHSDKEKLFEIVKKTPSTKIMSCKDANGLFVPAVINDKNMTDFIRVAGSKEQQVLFIDPTRLHFKPGDRVRIIGGTFVGLEGYFIQIGAKHEKRVIVHLDRLIAVATTAIPASLIEKIKD